MEGNKAISTKQLLLIGVVLWVIGGLLAANLGDNRIIGDGIVIVGHICLIVGLIQGGIKLFKKKAQPEKPEQK